MRFFPTDSEGGATVFLTRRCGCGIIFELLSGGLRYAATTGYYLTAFRLKSDRCVFTQSL